MRDRHNVGLLPKRDLAVKEENVGDAGLDAGWDINLLCPYAARMASEASPLAAAYLGARLYIDNDCLVGSMFPV